jgi:hypothetical protein
MKMVLVHLCTYRYAHIYCLLMHAESSRRVGQNRSSAIRLNLCDVFVRLGTMVRAHVWFCCCVLAV